MFLCKLRKEPQYCCQTLMEAETVWPPSGMVLDTVGDHGHREILSLCIYYREAGDAVVVREIMQGDRKLAGSRNPRLSIPQELMGSTYPLSFIHPGSLQRPELVELIGSAYKMTKTIGITL